jgi:uncharacterized protein YuzE
VIKASEDRRSFEVKRQLTADPARKLPSAEVLITFHSTAAGEVRLMAEYIQLQGAGDVAETRDFDDGMVTVDLDAQGRLAGIEYLSGRGPKELPEFAAYVRASGNHVMRAAATELLFNWRLAEALIRLVGRASAEGLLDQLTQDRNAELWQQELAFA